MGANTFISLTADDKPLTNMPNENENIDSQNDEAQDVENLENTSEELNENESDDVEALKEKNRQLFARAKKAEAKAKESEKKPEPKQQPSEKKESSNLSDDDKKDTRAIVREELQQEHLDSLDLSDELKKTAKTYAKVEGVSITEALKSPYIKFRQEEAETKKRNEAAAAGGGGASYARQDPEKIDPGKFDLRTKEGQDDKTAWEKSIAEKLG